MTNSITTTDALKNAGLINAEDHEAIETVASRYAVSITPQMLEQINQPNDPVARQFVPDPRELTRLEIESTDPISDHAFSPVEGIVHRYPDRVLLKAVHVCPVYCRFCFRREMVGPQGDGLLNNGKLEKALNYIRENPEIWEVILTGGDPLVLSPNRLRAILEPLRTIDHVKVLRIHSRVPLVDPERITEQTIDILKESGKTVYVALHANHPQEFSDAGRAACARLVDNGITMVSQSVLLKGVNDDIGTLTALMRTFVENRIKPYYLHHPDLAPGTSHFRVSVEEGQRLVSQLRGAVSGLCQPAYMLDIPGGHGKAVINRPEFEISNGQLKVRDFNDGEHRYEAATSASEKASAPRKE